LQMAAGVSQEQIGCGSLSWTKHTQSNPLTVPTFLRRTAVLYRHARLRLPSSVFLKVFPSSIYC
jgi:hypothetical protein